MINRFEDELEIFDNFVIDKSLPKHKVVEKANISGFNEMSVSIGGTAMWTDGGAPPQENIVTKKPSLLGFIKFLFKKKPIPKISVKEFFANIKNSTEEIVKITERAEGYEEILQCAIDAGQTALVEEIKDGIGIVRSESQLLAKGIITIITEEQVIQFFKESEKGIRLDWVKNFNRMIPCEIVETKKGLDELCVFDNYVVMHYDPGTKSYKMTKAEKEKRKDPILFGVIKNSRKLYYVGDWEDEVCDLTLDKLVSKFGKEAIKQNDLTVNIKFGKK